MPLRDGTLPTRGAGEPFLALVKGICENPQPVSGSHCGRAQGKGSRSSLLSSVVLRGLIRAVRQEKDRHFDGGRGSPGCCGSVGWVGQQTERSLV